MAEKVWAKARNITVCYSRQCWNLYSEVKNGVLYINGKEVEQPFINTNNDKKTVFIDDFTLKELTGEDKVPEGKYFVMGDNRGVSKDSRMIGFIDKSAIEGKAVFTVWPLNRIGGLKDYSYLYQ